MAGPEARFQKKAMLKFRALPKSWWSVTQFEGSRITMGVLTGSLFGLNSRKTKKKPKERMVAMPFKTSTVSTS